MSAIIAAVSGPVWGTTDELGLYISSIEKQEIREKNEQTNGQGDIVSAAWHGQKYQISCEGQIEALASATSVTGDDLVGHTITITDTEFAGTYFIDDVTNSKSNSDWMSVSFTATRYPDTLTTTTTV